MFAAIFIPDFRLQAVLRREPELHNAPVVLMNSANAGKAIVIECTVSAGDAGVCFGLSAPQAMARCSELIVKVPSAAAEQSATDAILQTAYAFSPNLEHTAPGVCTIDLRGLGVNGIRGNETCLENAEREVRSAEWQRGFAASAETNDAQHCFGFFTEVSNAGKAWCPHHAAPDAITTTDVVESARRHAEDNVPYLKQWAEKIVAALHQLHLRAQIGIAATPNLALLAARSGRQESFLRESSEPSSRLEVRIPIHIIQNTTEFFTSLPIEALDPTPEVLDILKRWGIHTAGAFLALGKDRIAERLGPPALELFERASDRTIRSLNTVVPLDTFEEQIDFEREIETLEPLLFVLRRFVEQLAARIALTYRVIAELDLRLTLTTGEKYIRTFKVPAPTANIETLFRMLHTHLENLHTDAPITSLCLSAMPCRAETQQFGLFESALRDPNHFHETLARLTALLGVERVGMPVPEQTHRPDAFRMEVPRFDGCSKNSPGDLESGDSSFFGNVTRRVAFGNKSPNEKAATNHRNSKKLTNANRLGPALRRFRPAIHADVEMERGRPVFLNTLLVSSHIVKARGPWCASGDWWDQRRWLRQEWDIQTPGGVYRLFCADGCWFLDGVYD